MLILLILKKTTWGPKWFIHALDAPFLIQLPANMPGETIEYDASSCLLPLFPRPYLGDT